MPTLRERVAGGLVGLLVGDALGVPYEFHPPEAIPALDLIEFSPPEGFARSYPQVPPGTWSDDGAQALALLASLLRRGHLDPDDLARQLVAWYTQGHMAVDSIVFDVGVQTAKALRRLMGGVGALEAGGAGEHDNGNGSLMRVLPLALWHRGSDAELVRDARLQSLLTHAHPRAQVCCALYCLWARRTLQAHPQPWDAAVAALRAIYPEGSLEREELETHIRPDDPPKGGGSGYVVDTLHSARWALQADGYEAVVRRAVSLGHDTDTTACVAGGIAGIRHGLEGIPLRWRQKLRGRELYEGLLQGLVEWASS
jgi:ADP-ribosylglycohydrolase